jgi:chorismate synthase
MRDGSGIRIRAAFKPTPSISLPQNALGRDGKVHDLEIRGRHDPLIAPRAAVVVECMTAITLLDLLMRSRSARLEDLI